MWEDVEGQESFPVNAGFELTTQGLLVQENNYSAMTHTSAGTNMRARTHARTHTHTHTHIKPYIYIYIYIYIYSYICIRVFQFIINVQGFE